MTWNKTPQLFGDNDVLIATIPPFIWPDPRWHSRQGFYESAPPFNSVTGEADLISGVLVGVADKTVGWLNSLLKNGGKRRVILVVILYAAGPTRREHLLSLQALTSGRSGTSQELEVRLLPVNRVYGHDFEKMTIPPNVLQAVDSSRNKTWLHIGSVGDVGHDNAHLASFNVLFEPDERLRDNWRRWFQYLFSSSAPLTPETVQIPHLVPAKGDPVAAQMWADYVRVCRSLDIPESQEPTVDPTTGEVIIEADGSEVKPWDKGQTKLDPLAEEIHRVYSRGYLVTVDETTRIKPLAIPVKAALLGQKSQRTFGSITRKQSFTLEVLGMDVSKKLEKLRLLNELIGLLTYPLSKGNRWLPDAARDLLEKEIENRNRRGREVLREALRGNDVRQFIGERKESLRTDLDAMYRELGQGSSVPEDIFTKILRDIEDRVSQALDARITPRAVYNRIAPPSLSASAPDENWTQPLSLLMRSASLLRESFTDAYFQRRFSGVSFSREDFLNAMDIWGDVILRKPDLRRAQEELKAVEELDSSQKRAREKCLTVWHIIRSNGIRGEQRSLFAPA